MPTVLEATLVGLQAVRTAYGRESPQYATAWQLLSQTLAASLQHLRTAYNGRYIGPSLSGTRVPTCTA